MPVRGRSPRISLFAPAFLLAACRGGHAQELPEHARGASVPTALAAPEVSAPPSAAPIESAAPPVAEPAPAPDAGAPNGVRTIGRCEKPGGIQRFTLAHLNDLQARYTERIGGKSRYAYIAGYLRQLKRERPTLVLDAGDDYEKGSIVDLRSLGEATRQMVQALPIDVRTIGNHDFAYGEAALMRDLTLSSHPVLAANITRGESKTSPFLPFVRVDVGCVKVGILGLVTAGYGADDEATREPYFGTLIDDDAYYATLQRLVAKHRREVDVLIALTHIGKRLDIDLAKANASVDVYVGGHSEDLLTDLEGARYRDRTHAYVMQAGHYGRYIGRADLAVRPDKTVVLERYRLVSVDESVPVADDVHELAAKLEAEYAPDALRVIGTVQADIAAGAPMVELVKRAAEATWGADALLLGTDIFFNPLLKGPLTLQRLYDSVYVQREPSGTTGFTSLYTVSMTGAEIAQAKARLRGSHAFITPDTLAATKTYKVAIEKRALVNPQLAFSGGVKLGAGRFAGEIIDVLEAYARERTRAGRAL